MIMNSLTNSEKLRFLKLNSFLGGADESLLMAIVEHASYVEFEKK